MSQTTAAPATDVAGRSVDTIRMLAVDAVERAGSGHPGTAMALAPVGYVLFTQFLRHNPDDPAWFDRDRFVLSNGHASLLQYALLHLCGYDLPLEELGRYRQWASRTPGHPERGVTPGVETTTGPLGQGLLNSVGLALAEAHLAATFNRPGHAVVHHRTWALCGDGDLMEGASHEAASLAGHLRLHKLTWIYDDNHVTIGGPTELTFSEDVPRRFEACGWHVQDLGERAEDRDALAEALATARDETARPSLVVVRSHIARGAPEKVDTSEAHGSPLGEDEAARTREAYGWPADADLLVPEEVGEHMVEVRRSGRQAQREWRRRVAEYERDHPQLGKRFRRAMKGDLPAGWQEALPRFAVSDGPLATRAASGRVLSALSDRVPELIGGSADLGPSNETLVDGRDDVAAGEYAARNLRWGVREHLMCGASNGLALHGGVRPFAATFLVFTDYARPAIRLAALMGLPVVYVMTHDSVGLGGDGPTHQPVEHLASLRALPGLHVIRPADAEETSWAWRAALERQDGPTLLALTRQKVPVLDRSSLADASGLMRGGYVLAREAGEHPDLVLIATGSEVALALQAREAMGERGRDVRVVSLPCWELFRAQDAAWRDRVLPPDGTPRMAVEAGSAQGWCEWTRDASATVTLDRFGASAPGDESLARLGFTVEALIARAERLPKPAR